jgi:DNA-binding response OmpR family regulator
VVGTLAKPFDLATLEARIAAALERARARVP